MEAIYKFYNQIAECATRAAYITELSYDGNVGLHELVLFYRLATPEELVQFDMAMEDGDTKQAWVLVQNVVGVILKGK